MFAFVFPGQGSQSSNMLFSLSEKYGTVRETFSEASDVLAYDLWALVTDASGDRLNQTQYTQPALLAASVSIWRIWLARGGKKPDYLAGHSLGEYTALVCANAIRFGEAVSLVAQRGEAMQAAAPKGAGAMAAIIGLEDATVLAICRSVSQEDILTPANFNSPGQVVIAGNTAAVERAIGEAKAQGARMAKRIPVSVPSHCALMQSAAAQMEDALSSVAFQSPEIPIVHNVDADYHQAPCDIRAILVKQLCSPIRWVDTIQRLVDTGVQTVFECGPGNVLTGLNKRIDKTLTLASIHSPDTLDAALNRF